MSYLMHALSLFINEQDQISELGKKKLEEIKQQWIDAKHLPRKKKKKLRKILQKEYYFYKQLNDWHNNMFNFNL